MRIGIASGKGGTGKTTVATNLALVASRNGKNVVYVDCDVEEPNGHIFLKPQITERKTVQVLVPEVDQEKCVLCGKCAEICQYNSLAVIGEKVLVYPELCHSCGGCWLVCPVEAITRTGRVVGVVETGISRSIHFVHGMLNVGEAMSPPVIKSVKDEVPESDFVFIDSPPGASCPVVESIRDCDYVILVTEPTPFGLNDFQIAIDTVRALSLPFGAVINRSGLDGGGLEAYCRQQGIEVLVKIPDDRRIAETYSRGEMICDALPQYSATFEKILERLGEF